MMSSCFKFCGLLLILFCLCTRCKQAQHKASEADMEIVDELLSSLDVGVVEDSEGEQSLAPTQMYKDGVQRRAVKGQLSDVSLDEEGFPKCLQDEPVKTPVKPNVFRKPLNTVQWNKKVKGEETRFAFFESGHSLEFLSKLNEDLGDPSDEVEAENETPDRAPIRKVPASSQQSPAKGSPKAKAKGKASSAATKASVDDDCKHGQTTTLGKVKLVPAALQTDIVHQPAGDRKWPLVVAVSQNQSVNHLQLGTAIFKAILADDLDKAQAVAKRQELLEI